MTAAEDEVLKLVGDGDVIAGRDKVKMLLTVVVEA